MAKGSKSISLMNGSFGTRKNPDKVIIPDKEKFINWWKSNNTHGYELVKDIISIDICDFAYEFVKHWEVRQKILKDVTSPIEFGVPTDDFFGCISDTQVPGALSLRGIPFFDSLLVYLMPVFEKTLNKLELHSSKGWSFCYSCFTKSEL